ncbi:MAG: hypothetical protein ACKVRO_11985 [Micropepsaceae bacterium]
MTDIERFELGSNIGAAYGLVGRNLGTLAILFAAWGIVAVVAGLAGAVGTRLLISGIPELAAGAADMSDEAVLLIGLVPFFVVFMIGLSAVIIAWHRRIITGTGSRNPFSVGPDPIFRYIAGVVVVFGISFAPIVLTIAGALAFASKPGGSGSAAAFGFAIFALVIACTLATLRFSLLFPAIAVGDRTMTLSRSWQLTKYSTWRLFWGSFVCALPFSIAGNIIEKVLGVQGLAETVPGIALAILGTAIELLAYANVAAFISLAYVQLTGIDGAIDRPPASHFS